MYGYVDIDTAESFTIAVRVAGTINALRPPTTPPAIVRFTN